LNQIAVLLLQVGSFVYGYDRRIGSRVGNEGNIFIGIFRKRTVNGKFVAFFFEVFSKVGSVFDVFAFAVFCVDTISLVLVSKVYIVIFLQYIVDVIPAVSSVINGIGPSQALT